MISRRRFVKTTAAGLAVVSLGGAASMLSGCSGGTAASTSTASSSAASSSTAAQVPHFNFMDMHCDTLDALSQLGHGYVTEDIRGQEEGPQDGDLYSNTGAVSVDRKGDMGWVQCYAVFSEGEDELDESLYGWYRRAADYFHEQMGKYPDIFEQVTDARDIDAILAKGKVAAILTVENSTPLEGNVDMVDAFIKDGVKMASLTWNQVNPFASGNESTQGITELGRQLVQRYEENKIVIDVSHLNDEGFADLLAMHTRPFVASHSNSRAVCDVKRNLTDDQFRAIRDMGGVVGLNLYPVFVNGAEDTAGEPDYKESLADGGRFSYTFDELAKHIEHWLELDGADVIAFGSDADGAACPDWCYGAQTRAALYQKFVDRFGQETTDKLFFTNVRDFFVRNETI